MSDKSAREHKHYDEEFLYDVRLIERHLERGLITRASLEKHLGKMADSASQGEAIDLDQLTAIASSRRPGR